MYCNNFSGNISNGYVVLALYQAPLLIISPPLRALSKPAKTPVGMASRTPPLMPPKVVWLMFLLDDAKGWSCNAGNGCPAKPENIPVFAVVQIADDIDCFAMFPCTRSPSYAVDVLLGIVGDVIIVDVGNVLDID